MPKEPGADNVRSLAQRLLIRAHIREDAKQLADLIHDDFIGVETDGSIVTKEEEIDILLNTAYLSGRIIEDAVIRRDRVTIIIGTAVFQTTGPEAHFRFTDILVEGKLISSHTTQLS
jgi:hypothetical protein